jgi:hypothetical protein
MLTDQVDWVAQVIEWVVTEICCGLAYATGVARPVSGSLSRGINQSVRRGNVGFGGKKKIWCGKKKKKIV